MRFCTKIAWIHVKMQTLTRGGYEDLPGAHICLHTNVPNSTSSYAETSQTKCKS
jgi:hypothetical protein